MRRAGRVFRALLLAASATGLAVSAQASSLNQPYISGLNSYVVAAGQPVIVSGNHFSNDLTGDCSAGTPQVIFQPVTQWPPSPSGSAIGVAPASTNSSDCTNTMVKVTVPSIPTGSATVAIKDGSGNSSPAPNFVLTNQPSASISPTQGPVDTVFTINGSNLDPPAAAGSLSVSFPSETLQPGWGNTISGLNPGNQGGAVNLSFAVHYDTNNPGQTTPVHVGAGQYTFLPPQVSGLSPNEAVVGNQVTITGQYLGSPGSVSLGGVGAPIDSWSDHAITVTVPAGVPDNAGVGVSVRDYGAPGGLSGLQLTVDPRVTGMSPTSAVPGSTVRVTGTNLGSSGEVTIGGARQQTTSWTPTSVGFTLSPDVDPGTVTVTRSDGKGAATSASLQVVPKITQLEQNNVSPGAAVVVDGVGFGSGQGTVSLAGRTLTPQLWSRTSVLIGVPPNMAPGRYNLDVVSSYGVASNAMSLVVTSAPPTPQPGSSAAAAQGNPFVPHFDNKHDFVKPIPPPSPVRLSLDAEPKKVGPGGTSTLTVTLTLNGKPVDGAQVKLSVIYSPCTGDTFSAPEGTTDGTGTFRSTITLCGKPGQHVILAESGLFSDQDAVDVAGPAGKTAASAGGGAQVNPASGVPTPLLALGAVAAALVGVGVYVNLRSHGWI